jgi:chromosome segregation ATPase
VTNPPFRALDEWDVFLDAVNRSRVYREMLKVALEQVSRPLLKLIIF